MYSEVEDPTEEEPTEEYPSEEPPRPYKRIVGGTVVAPGEIPWQVLYRGVNVYNINVVILI